MFGYGTVPGKEVSTAPYSARALGSFAMIGLIFLVNVVSGLRLTSMEVPNSVTVGSTVRLNCIYDLEGDILYSLKWYKTDIEFYRYVPSDRPQSQIFPLAGVNIDVDKSVNGTVFLTNISASSAGLYRCEVSSDAPTFQTVVGEKAMLVEELDE